MSFESAKAFIFQKAGKNYPAPLAAVDTIQGLLRFRDKAIPVEGETYMSCKK